MWSGTVTHDGVAVAHWLFTSRNDDGVSEPPYQHLNLGARVGDSDAAVSVNRQRFAQLAGQPGLQVAWPQLCHSARIALVAGNQQQFPEVDGLITRQPNVGLATLGADCVQVLAVDVANRVALSAHMGWRGAADGMGSAITAAIAAAGGELRATQFWLGPSICGDCYQVPAERRDLVATRLPAAVRSTGLDLRIGLAEFLGDRAAAVQLIGGCTFEDESLFSFRRESVTGRQGGLVVLL